MILFSHIKTWTARFDDDHYDLGTGGNSILIRKRSTNRTTGELDVEPLKLLELTRVPVVTCHREGCYGKPPDVDSWRSLNS